MRRVLDSEQEPAGAQVRKVLEPGELERKGAKGTRWRGRGGSCSRLRWPWFCLRVHGWKGIWSLCS